jgi:hypothetical protein
MARTHRTGKRALAEALRKIADLEAELRASTIERIIDVQVLAGLTTEKERSEELLKMADPTQFPLAALEALRSSLLRMTVRLNHASEGSGEAQNQTQPRGYIQ